mmetsp:Transcript_10193/g.27952  ORF Transcript_10193/g.27952 Transcript_10193/m.27952 type:complete len:194 (-) Transcript_10193:2258-2839(-)
MKSPANKPSAQKYNLLCAAYVAYGLGVGYYAGMQPINEWRYFSWHPFLMTSGMVMMMGIAAMTKKLGGYSNTKNHGYLANVGVMLALGGLYVIYQNKEMNGAPHFTSYHGKAGLALVVASIGAGMAGGIFLHPDFGIDKTNKTVRFAHKTMARCVLGLAWGTCVAGMYTLSNDALPLMIVGAPLVVLAPFTLM